jgi:hypothetical protein
VARKHVAVHVPLQMGFGFEVQDSKGMAPPFLSDVDEVYAAIDVIQQAHWVSTDVETTGLTDASVPVALAPVNIKQGASNVVRMRTIQARVPTVRGRRGERTNFVFDCDKMGPKLTAEVARAVLSRRMFIAHNAGFDLYWLRLAEGRRTMPAMVVDTMLMTRLLRPELVLVRAELIRDIKHINDVPFAEPVAQAAWKSLISGASGGSLADVVLAMFNVIVDKTYQMPTNWTGLLGFAHYDYANDDTVWADRILCNLLEVDDEGDLLQAYLGRRARQATVRLIEPQVPELVLLREKGMPINADVGRRYVIRKRAELATKVDELIAMEPTLETHRDALADPDAGLDDGLKRALATAFEARGVVLRRTPTGAPQVGEKDLRACRAVQIDASRPLFNAWVAVCRAKKSSAMALEVVGFAVRGGDGRVRSLLSHGPVTGRLSASEPNCFTGATEILTKDGWVRFDQLPRGVPVAQYERGAITFVQPDAYIEHHFDGELVHNRTRAINLLTTPNHRCLVVNRNTGAEQVYDASAYPEDHIQLHAADYAGGAGLPLADTEIRFLVAAQADGSWHAGGLDFTFCRERKVARFAELFGAEFKQARQADGSTGARHRVRLSKTHPLTRVARTYLGDAKSFGAWILELSRAQLDVLVDELDYWDGLYTRKGVSGTYTTIDKTSADWVHAAYTLSGTRARLIAYKASGERKNQTWRVQAPKARASSYTTNRVQERVPYSGQVYCVSVPSGYIVVRHEGVAMVTGNCQQFPRDQLFRAMLISGTRPGCEYMRVWATELNKSLLEAVAERPVVIGEHVAVESAWMAAMFWSDKKVPEWPRDAYNELEAHIQAQFTHKIVASDFGALDVRVGAALCVRSQREMLALAKGIMVPGPVQPPESVVKVIRKVAPLLDGKDPASTLENQAWLYEKDVQRLEARLEKLKEDLDAERIQRRIYFQRRGEMKDELLCAKLGWRLAQCLAFGAKRGEREYSALRDAFVADIDIHTFTGMKLVGRDPMQEFDGLSVPDRKALEKKLKKELGPRRQQGKIANLSLLYGMADAGFQEAAARGYDEHWTMQEAHDIRALWMNAYPEVELWHLWTECLQAGVVYIPEKGREKPARSGWWMARTLAGRDIVAFGLNAALSYQDQSSGADILGLIMHRLHAEYPHVSECGINQVHDELVLQFPVEHHDEYLTIVETVMVECADSLTMPYGVPTAVSPACGPIWVKD